MAQREASEEMAEMEELAARAAQETAVPVKSEPQAQPEARVEP